MIGFVVTFHYPLNHHPARLAAEHLEGFWFGWTSISRAFSIAQSCLFVAASLAVAMVVRGPAGQASAGGAPPGAPALLLPGFVLLRCAAFLSVIMCTHDSFARKNFFPRNFASNMILPAVFFQVDGASSEDQFIASKTPRFCLSSSAWMHALAVSCLI